MINCKCGKEFNIKENIVKNDMGNGIISFGLKCPHCNHYTHSCFEDAQFRQLKLSVEKALNSFQTIKSNRLLKSYQNKRKVLNNVYDQIQEKYAYLLEGVNG